MKVKYLKVSFDNVDKYKYDFFNNTMIYSKENSKGKTTLVRFLLYALGYQIPATEGIGDFDKLEYEICIGNKKRQFNIYRKSNNIQVSCDEKIYTFILPEQENELHALIFGIDNITILNNLLAVYYIDQEKGWTLLNRGKIIGNIRFNIEEFIAGISNINIENLLTEKKVLNSEIKKYRYVKNAIDINSEFEDEEEKTKEYDNYDMAELLQEQKVNEINLKKVATKRKKIEEIIKTNSGFAEMIENYGLLVSHNGEEFILTRDKLGDFDRNQDILKIRLNNLKIEEEKIKSKLNKIIVKINEKNVLFTTESLIEKLQQNIESSGIDLVQVDKILRQLINKRNSINKQIKEKLSFNNQQLYDFYQTIVKYAEELKITQFISDMTPQYVLTNKLKGLSGRVLAQLCYIFKLSYIKEIEKTFSIRLPIIIDSPRTNELSEESTNNMLNILKRDFSKHQIITASIYKNSIINFEILDLNDGLKSDKFKI